jgi:hypothetical protein
VWICQIGAEHQLHVAAQNVQTSDGRHCTKEHNTDQVTGMKEAIDAVFREANQHNCRWRVIQNATEKLGSFMAKHPELLEAFNACVNNSLTPEKFETTWMAMITAHNIADNMDFFGLWD